MMAVLGWHGRRQNSLLGKVGLGKCCEDRPCTHAVSSSNNLLSVTAAAVVTATDTLAMLMVPISRRPDGGVRAMSRAAAQATTSSPLSPPQRKRVPFRGEKGKKDAREMSVTFALKLSEIALIMASSSAQLFEHKVHFWPLLPRAQLCVPHVGRHFMASLTCHFSPILYLVKML